MSDDLVKRLRDWPVTGITTHEAADRIEALELERDEWQKDSAAAWDKCEERRIAQEAAEAALAAMTAERDRYLRHLTAGAQSIKDNNSRAKAAEAALAAMTQERDEMAAAITDMENNGICAGGNLWRFWSKKSIEIATENAFLRARLAKAVEALRFYSCDNSCDDCPVSERGRISCGWTARATLAEIDPPKEERT